VPHDTPPPRTGRDFDVAGALLGTGAMLVLVLAVVRAPDAALGWTVALLAAAGALLWAFVAVERRAPAPLLRLGILRSGTLVRANLGAMLFIGAFVAFQFIVVLYLQELRGWSSLETGLALLVAGIDAVLTPTLTPRLIDRFGTARVTLAGMGLAAVAYALFLPLGSDWSYAAMLPTMVLIGLAFSLAFGALTIAATDGVAEHEQGLASGLLNVSFQFGAAIGLAVATAVYVSAAGDEVASLEAYRSALIVPVAAVLLGFLLTATGLRRQRYAAPSHQPLAAHS
jgi:predicted MFS family arabinose efflux permease